ncbi:Molecular chaperone (DnaJ superfamily) [Plasmopara halstedii]|uniref:Molecular chaperone (DnaJ superfamily) n=1 Tax=Plasmopara halstedii TaxID=4781 RepID=A0A0P1A4I2_PLAHL|nr:Molecular chaperone (DnaJ superfamily) [Plasmopara halstedii]CEG35405.1 Molecular chaperone (DnaJ superfamily) [Plasmopara halstedii]|eukprot:XP_024571774.1 Molecular chaperone (DnaJ superfamily) [Plasmopara halstedii]
MAAALIHAEFGDDCDLYAVLCVERSAGTRDITRAYRKLALKYHPDKQRGDDASRAKATAKFQAVSAIHSILSDKEARAVYDESGTILADASDEKSPSFQTWSQYFARVFPKVTKEKITEFEEEYRFSEEERRDVLIAYTKYEGEMQHVMDTIMLSIDDDENRFVEMIQKAIEDKEVKNFPAWKKYIRNQSKKKERKLTLAEQKRKIAKREKEARAAEDLFNKIRGKHIDRSQCSTALSTERKRGFELLLGSLEAKYAEKGKKSKRKSEPSEEEFKAAQTRLNGNSKRSEASK